MGFKGGLENCPELSLPYYATHDAEILFHVIDQIPDAERMKMLESNRVLITFLDADEKSVDKYNTNQWKHDLFVNIIIQPLRNGLFRIQIAKNKNWIGAIGPLIDGSIVSISVLGSMIRQTAINACKIAYSDRARP